MKTCHPAVFFDRDDTLIVNVPYLGDPKGVRVYPEAAAALRRLKGDGFRLVIISNQSGVGRGLITREQVAAVNEAMIGQLGESFFEGIYNCYSSPEDPYCTDRKPSPALVHLAAREHRLDLARSFFVGDRLSDIECGRNAGCRSVLVLTGSHREEQEKAKPISDFIAANLTEAVAWICERHAAGVAS